MFRIHIQRQDAATTLTVEGTLTGPRVKELERCWRSEGAAGAGKRMIVKLAAVSFVDADGRALLSTMRRQGATLVAHGCLMKAIVHQIDNELN